MVCLEGPTGVGKTTLLAALSTAGYTVLPAPAQLTASEHFNQTVFAGHIKRWEELQQHQGAILVESSPWGYAALTGNCLPATSKAAVRTQLAHLPPPSCFLVLSTSGREVARRRGYTHGPEQDAAATVALR